MPGPANGPIPYSLGRDLSLSLSLCLSLSPSPPLSLSSSLPLSHSLSLSLYLSCCSPVSVCLKLDTPPFPSSSTVVLYHCRYQFIFSLLEAIVFTIASMYFLSGSYPPPPPLFALN